jgi:hypothetical protein
MKNESKGIYVSPEAVMRDPDYTRLLIREHGIRTFVLRTGFQSGAVPETLKSAIQLLRKMEAHICLLVGAWWGEGVDPGEKGMKSLASPKWTGKWSAYESQWRMHCPGGQQNGAIEAALIRLIRENEPDSICLTHARFRHPADISGLFETGSELEALLQEDGMDISIMVDGLGKVERSIAASDPKELLELSSSCDGLGGFLDQLSQSAHFSTWFAIRCRLIEQSLRQIGAVVAHTSAYSTAFGTNAVAPTLGKYCGQDYTEISRCCDFIQPLLGYVRWHILQSVCAWGYFLMDLCPSLNNRKAMTIACRLFRINGDVVQDGIRVCEREDEGGLELIMDILAGQVGECERLLAPRTSVWPVFRGNDWPLDVYPKLGQLNGTSRFNGMHFQGTSFMTGRDPKGWN